jgi:hypothetical protein
VRLPCSETASAIVPGGVDREGNLTLGTLGIGVAFVSLALCPF